jgi:hypothetical protein
MQESGQPLRTVVYQSFRTVNVPLWITRCMQTVQRWAGSQGFDYRFIDDALFGYAPEWYREKVSHDILLVSDLARLVLARDLLREGYGRTIWVDADVVIFDTEQLAIDVADGFAFCRELWFFPAGNGQTKCQMRVNNAVTVFVEPTEFLDFYIRACELIVRNNHQLSKLSVGTRFLTAMHQVMPFRLINHVGLFSPALMAQLVRGVEPVLELFRRVGGSPIYAANLCGSFRNTTFHGVLMDDSVYNAVVDNLLRGPQGLETS